MTQRFSPRNLSRSLLAVWHAVVIEKPKYRLLPNGIQQVAGLGEEVGSGTEAPYECDFVIGMDIGHVIRLHR
ncbi:hypothetical protein M378DRAFT_159429 [Amanita muscaria Koide BX008]|uniref:Uncharacterized protein n=1 Tax=Amanita muscaria (strain Koide BX008) TaxID=946122 RepID=A0A0C2XFH4_AMAMK|nr:hypothetical protein M378DRAFT_159429 [Amanita muscaria Koide BX008]